MSKFFLASFNKGTTYLAWKDGDVLHWVPTNPDCAGSRTTGNSSPPTTASIRSELLASPPFAGCAPTAVRVADRSSLPPGYYHPRVWRPWFPWVPSLPETPGSDAAAMRASILPLQSLLERLAVVVRTVEPAGSQLNVFGHEIRQLLVLACNAVESAWTNVLKQNMSTPLDRPTTKDYVRLREPMRLPEWRVEFSNAPKALILAPFDKWDGAAPTKSLAWYDAYNETKHNQEEKLSSATLGKLLDALAAACIMNAAQFGPDCVQPLALLGFRIAVPPEWSLAPLRHSAVMRRRRAAVAREA